MQNRTLGAIALPLLLLAPMLTSCTASRFLNPPTPNASAATNSSSFPATRSMTVEALESILKENATNLEKRNNQQWVFEYDGVPLLLMTNTEFDRIRLLSPIIEDAEIAEVERQAMLQANFHTALDARYAISNGVVFAVYLHPLSSLHENDFRAALIQVSQLVKNFGSTYSSGGPTFGEQSQ